MKRRAMNRRSPRVRRTALAAALLACAIPLADAGAGGLSRVNTISPRAVGMGGAFGAVADDPSALHFNPAGLATVFGRVLAVGLEYIYSQRTYTPVNEEGVEGAPQEPNQASAVVPSIGFVLRPELDGSPSRLSFGVGLWNTYGGQVSYDKTGRADVPALNRTREALLELVAGVGYEASEYVSVGLAVRVGFGLFDVDATARPITSVMSATGFGVGLTGGIMLSNGGRLEDAGTARLGVVYRTPMTVATAGDATLDMGGGPTELDIEHSQQWPQSAAIAAAWRPLARLLVAAEVDWTDWSRVNTLTVEFPDRPDLDQSFDMDWSANTSYHLGGEITVNRRVRALVGGAYDTRAVPFRTMERDTLDSDKFTADAGVMVALTERWRVLGALDVILSREVEIENNTAEARESGWLVRANKAPGTHSGRVMTFELAAHYLF
jgi:long-chain fatty acid transport protein